MTKHEALTYLNIHGRLSSKQLYELCGDRAYRSCWEMLTKMNKWGLLSKHSIVNKEIFFEMTNAGVERLHYFDNGGCNRYECHCHEKE